MLRQCILVFACTVFSLFFGPLRGTEEQRSNRLHAQAATCFCIGTRHRPFFFFFFLQHEMMAKQFNLKSFSFVLFLSFFFSPQKVDLYCFYFCRSVCNSWSVVVITNIPYGVMNKRSIVWDSLSILFLLLATCYVRRLGFPIGEFVQLLFSDQVRSPTLYKDMFFCVPIVLLVYCFSLCV